MPELGLDDTWPLILLGLRIAIAAALYLFLLNAFRALRAELRNRPSAGAAGDAGPRFWLEVVRCEGEDALVGRVYPLDSVTLIGRDPTSTIVLPDARVSSHHARLVRRDGGWWIEDLGATNGTFVDERRVGGPEPLNGAREVRFGPVVARLRREVRA
ncbi:MAG: FHA domain-containing protein [Dehalococcoidia bacterium]|nr:FHA domain-containing protein [Dehalococcoidia bacterium]